MKKYFPLLVGVLVFPTVVQASVRISEVAWMGIVNSSSDEWIELYNDGDMPQDVADWTISVSTKKLSGTVPAHGYYLLERTDDTTVPDIAADVIYTGALNDTGVRLALKDASGAEINVVDASAGWPAGDKDTKDTMQWNGTVWISAPGTPKAANATVASVKTDTTNTGTATSTDTATFSSTIDTSAHVSPLPLSSFSQKQELYISAGRNRIAAAGSPISFEVFAVDTQGKTIPGVSAVWSFGDGTSAGGVKVSHFYKYPGDYVVILNTNSGGSNAVSRAEIRVFTPKISLRFEDGALVLTNNSPCEINVGGWKLHSGNVIFIIPDDTIIGAGKEVIFASEVTGIIPTVDVPTELILPCGKVLKTISFELEKPQVIATIATTTTAVAVLTTPVKNIAPIEKPKNSVAVAALAPVSKPNTPVACGTKDGTSCAATSGKTITLKKQDGFFSRIVHFFFR